VSGQRFFFVHVQKAAGTSLVFRLRRHFGRAAIYPPEADKDDVAAVISVDHLLERWRTQRDTIRVVTGHFPLCTVDLLEENFTTVTVLRDPVERTLSYLRHHRELTPVDSGRSLEAIYADPFRFHGFIHNHMVKMFSLTAAEMTHGMLTRVQFTSDRLDRAKERLAGVDVVGFQSRFEEFCEGLTRRFGWYLGPRRHVNRTEPVEVSEAFLTRIAEDNAMDMELYAFAQQLREQRTESAASETHV
jgi:Sulfotransferase family